MVHLSHLWLCSWVEHLTFSFQIVPGILLSIQLTTDQENGVTCFCTLTSSWSAEIIRKNIDGTETSIVTQLKFTLSLKVQEHKPQKRSKRWRLLLSPNFWNCSLFPTTSTACNIQVTWFQWIKMTPEKKVNLDFCLGQGGRICHAFEKMILKVRHRSNSIWTLHCCNFTLIAQGSLWKHENQAAVPNEQRCGGHSSVSQRFRCSW